MINQEAKLNQKSIQDIQDESFIIMSIEGKLSLLDDFFRFGKELQNLNNRKKVDFKTWKLREL